PARGLAGSETQDVPGLVFRLDRPGLPLLQRQVDDEHAALADLAGHRDGPAHQADELPADRQAQAGARPRLLPGLGLLELAEQLGLVVRRNARAGVLNLDPEARPRRPRAVRADADADAALVRELDGVAEHVDEDLAQLVDVGHDIPRDGADRLHGKRQPLFVRP